MSGPESPSPRGLAGLSDELRLTLLLFLFSFFISGVPRVYTQTAAHALFIEAYGAAALPWAYLAEALCVPLAGYLYLVAEKRLSLARLMVLTLASQMVALVLFHQGIAAGVPLVAGASIVYFEIEFVLSSLLLWGLANQLMTLRQGKRLFGFVSAGEPVAIIVCGLSTPLLLRWLAPADLFLLSALGAAVGIGLVLHILRQHPPTVSADDAQAEADRVAGPTPPARAWWHDPYVRTLVVLVLVGQMAYFFVDNAFYVEADKRFPDEHAMASFLGVYSAVMGAVSLVCSVLLAPWLLRRFGVRGGLLVLPLLLLLGALATVLVGGLGGPADVLFWLVVGNKIIDQSFRYTLDKTTFVTLFQPLPARQRLRVQAGLEGMVEPLSGGLAGILLFVLIQGLGLGAVGITAVILCVACVWVGLVAVQYRGYLGSLRAALAGRRVVAERLSVDDPASRQLLHQGLRSARAGEVLYSLSLLDGADEPLGDDEVTPLMRHPEPEVRLELLQRIENGRSTLAPQALCDALTHEGEAKVRAALVRALAARGEAWLPAVAAWLDSEDLDLAMGARVGLIRHGGIEGVLLAGPHLLADQRAIDPARRRRAAQVMEQVGSTQFYRPLLELMADDDPSVVAAALQAAGVVSAPQLWPAMVEALNQPSPQRAAVAALARVGDAVLPLLDGLLVRPDVALPARLALVDLFRRLASVAADQRLVALLDDTARGVRERALRALWQRRHRVPAAQAQLLMGRVQDEVGRAYAALAAWRGLAGDEGPDIAALRQVLAEDVALSVQACFHWLGLATDSFDVHEAHAHYERGDPARRAYVMEMLDNLLPAPIKRPLLDLLEPASMAEQAARASVQALAGEAPAGSLSERLWWLAAQAPLSAFARAAAAYLGAQLQAPSQAAECARRLPPPLSEEVLMRDTLAWVCAGCTPLKERPAMLTIEKMLVLRSVSLFAGVRESFLLSVAASASEVFLGAGEVLFEEGELGTSLYVIASGELEVAVAGKRVAVLGERDVVGEMAALDPQPRSARVSALQEALLLRLTDQDLDLLMSEDAEVARAIIQTLCKRLRSARS